MVDVASFVLDVVKCLAAPIGRPFKYLYNYNTNFNDLQNDVEQMKLAKDKVQRKVDAAERNLEKIEETVEKWQKDVDSIIDEAEKLIQAKDNNPRCFKGLCPNWITRYKHSKKAFKLKENDISQLLDKEFNEVSYPTIQQEIWLRSTKDYVALESRTSTVKNVWDALNDENIDMIGVYGMGGIGKTTLVQEVVRKAKDEQLFDEVVFIEVTETPNIETIQLKIAKKLGLELEKESDVADKANKLYERLKMSKKDKKDGKERPMKILLILDNIWEALDLATVGIPSGDDRGGCKLLLTTRDRDVLDRMGSTHNFGMGILNEEEAWSLFTKMTGDVIQTRELNSLPNDVCKECRGLPIVICTIAKALKNKSRPSDWKVALRDLKAPSPTKFIGLLEKEYAKIALSYEYLRDDELKKTFLISSLMENNTSISGFFRHVVGLDILEGANLTMEDARDRLDKLVRELKDSCLLLDGFENEQFAMHDVVRAVAVTISYTDHHVFTERNDVEREWKDKDKLKKCKKISLHGSSTVISQLWPKDLDCPDLEYFYMTNMWDSSFEIPKEFFQVMPKLKVLNVCGMQQSSLPSSLDLLTNLQTLCLDNSKIEDVAIIGKLKTLKVLSVQNAKIEELPTELGQLTQLRLLDLRNCWQLEVIAPNVISKLSQLEELYIKRCCIQWKVEVLKELKHLSQLASLEIDIKDNKMLPKDYFCKELKRCKISIGDWSSEYWSSQNARMGNKWLNSCEFSKMLEFKYDSTISLDELQNFKNVELLRLAEFSDDDNNLMPLFNEKVIFSKLMVLEMQVTSSRKIWSNQPPTFISSLTRLKLHGCRNIKYAFPFSIAKSLSNLQDIQISNCEVLEEIIAEEAGEIVDVNFVLFTQVTFLKLEDLPKLTTFCHGIDTWELSMLKRLVVRECEKFTSKYLSFQENSLHISEPKSFCLEHKINCDLKELELEYGSSLIQWESRSKKLEITRLANIPIQLFQRFENLEKLRLCSCGYKEIFSCGKDDEHMQNTLSPSLASFKYLKVLRLDSYNGTKLITPSMAKSLVQLRELSISTCDMVIEIVENEGEGDATTSIKIVFENLKKLSLIRLKSLTCFCSGNYSFNFPSLEELIIRECPDMKIFSQGILSTPKLSKINYERWNRGKWENIIEVENEGNDLNKTIRAYKKQDISLDLKLLTFEDDNSTEICYNQHPNSFYQNLTHLILLGCGNIKYAFPSSIAKSFQQLQHLKIQDCKVLEEIVAKETNDDDNFVFPRVTSLKLQNLPNFIVFYHTFEWPKLKELVVKNCAKFTTFKYLSFQENNKEGELHFSVPKSLFLNDKINFNLERLELANGIKWNEIKWIWQSQTKVLEIHGDKSPNIPLGLLHRFENLKELQLSRCEYKEIFSCGKEEKYTGRPNHKQIRILSDLPNFEILNVKCCGELLSLLPSSASLQNLKILSVRECRRLTKLITPSTARSLVQLREMSISFCGMLIEIVQNEGEGDASPNEIVFENLKKLSLEYLISLTCFCSGNYSFNFSSLEELFILECPDMKTFSKGILSTPKLSKVKYDRKEKDFENGKSELNTTIQQARKEKVDNSTELRFSEGEIIRIWQGELPKNFGKVKTLQLMKDESTNIPIQILQKFSRLETLKLQSSSYEEIFSCKENEEHVGTLTNLKVLELLKLLNLKCIWKQNSQLNSILQNLNRLEVQHCYNLTALLPSSASFENLSTLCVIDCNGLRNLMSSTTTRSLVRLVELEVEECEMMKEVLANEGDTEKETIVFEKLESLSMLNLESLTCFCSENHTLKFPKLKSLCVSQCSRMKIFSGGDLSMPRLQKLNYTDCSKIDPNTITQQLQNNCSEFCERYREEEEEEE